MLPFGELRQVGLKHLSSSGGQKKTEYDDILKRLGSLANPKSVEGMAKYGITPAKAYGVSIPDLRKIAKEMGTDHGLAQRLWQAGIRETQILASLIDDSRMVTEDQMESWVRDFDSWEACDQCCQNLFGKTKFAYQKAVEWSLNEKELIKRAGFVLMARLAVSDKKASDEQFFQFLPIIRRESGDGRNFVKKAVNWALRQIGKRNAALNEMAIKTAKEMQRMDSGSARWVASDAIRELTSEAVQKRLRG